MKQIQINKELYIGIVDENLVRGILRTYQDILEKEFNTYISEDDKGFSEDLAVKELCEIEVEEEIKQGKKYQVVGYIKVEPEKIELLTYEEALKEKEQGELMQPENIYKIEETE